MPREVNSPYDENKPWLDQARLDEVASQVSVLRATKTLTDAQIKALPTTPVDIIPAPGIGRRLFCSEGYLVSVNDSSYTNVSVDTGGVTGVFFYVDDSRYQHHAFGCPTFARTVDLLDAGPTSLRLAPNNHHVYINTDNEVIKGIVAEGEAKSDFDLPAENQPLRIAIDNYDSAYAVDLGNFTGGNSDNVWQIGVLYTIINL